MLKRGEKRKCKNKKVTRRIFKRKRKITFADKWRRLLLGCRSRVRDSRNQMHIANYIFYSVWVPFAKSHLPPVGMVLAEKTTCLHVRPVASKSCHVSTSQSSRFFLWLHACPFFSRTFLSFFRLHNVRLFFDWNKNVFRTTVVPTSARTKGYHYAEPHTCC